MSVREMIDELEISREEKMKLKCALANYALKLIDPEGWERLAIAIIPLMKQDDLIKFWLYQRKRYFGW